MENLIINDIHVARITLAKSARNKQNKKKLFFSHFQSNFLIAVLYRRNVCQHATFHRFYHINIDHATKYNHYF